VGDLDGVAGLLPLLVGGIQGIVHVVAVQFDHVSVGKDVDCLHDDLLGAKSAVGKLHLH
jgi:hypothetical protein